MDHPLKHSIICLSAIVIWGSAAAAEPALPVPEPCPTYSTFEIVIDTDFFADQCTLATTGAQPGPEAKSKIERDIDLDQTNEILEVRNAAGGAFTYYVFEDTAVGTLYKGSFIASEKFRVRKLSGDQVVLEFTLSENRIRLHYLDGQWQALP